MSVTPAILTRELKVGILGVGRIGQVHIQTLFDTEGVKPFMISDVYEPALKSVSEKFNIPHVSKNPMEVINHPDVDAIWICSPSQFHADQIKACAAAKKPCFCEKPIATELDVTIDAIDEADSAGIQLMTAFQRRSDPNFARLYQAIVDGDIGTPLSAVLISRDPAPPPVQYVKGGGGIFKDMAIHDLDIARWMMSAKGPNEPVEIYVSGGCFVDPDIKDLEHPSEACDTANIMITFENGATATIQVCRKSAYGYDQRVEVFGTAGQVKLDNVYASTVSKWNATYTGNIDLPYDFFMTRYLDAYRNETKAFVKFLKEGTKVTPSGIDGKIALVMALACDMSLKEKRPVKMSEILK